VDNCSVHVRILLFDGDFGMAKKKIKEDPKLLAVNDSIKFYGGCYANWRSGGCNGPMPEELLNRLIGVSKALDTYLKTYEIKEVE
jgi:hypothetical protein